MKIKRDGEKEEGKEERSKGGRKGKMKEGGKEGERLKSKTINSLKRNLLHKLIHDPRAFHFKAPPEVKSSSAHSLWEGKMEA
jgi:hypothetical protein